MQLESFSVSRSWEGRREGERGPSLWAECVLPWVGQARELSLLPSGLAKRSAAQEDEPPICCPPSLSGRAGCDLLPSHSSPWASGGTAPGDSTALVSMGVTLTV